jgi:hypothetical protein
VLMDCYAIVFKTKQLKTLVDCEEKDTMIFRNVGKYSLNTHNNISEDLDLRVIQNTRYY